MYNISGALAVAEEALESISEAPAEGVLVEDILLQNHISGPLVVAAHIDTMAVPVSWMHPKGFHSLGKI